MGNADARHRLSLIAVQVEMARTDFGGEMSSKLSSLRAEATAITASTLGRDHYLVEKLEAVSFGSSNLVNSTVASMMQDSSAASELVGLVRAVINMIGKDYAPRPQTFTPPCDPELWRHIRTLVEMEEWAKLPATVVTFTEDWFRKRAGNPRGKRDEKLVGKHLYVTVLSEHPLGQEASEHEGWRYLGMGLAQAIGNLHRHNVEERDDAEAFAWNVIGLASLLITEMKRTVEPPTPGDSDQSHGRLGSVPRQTRSKGADDERG